MHGLQAFIFLFLKRLECLQLTAPITSLPENMQFVQCTC